jgi:hypothetical protein
MPEDIFDILLKEETWQRYVRISMRFDRSRPALKAVKNV